MEKDSRLFRKNQPNSNFTSLIKSAGVPLIKMLNVVVERNSSGGSFSFSDSVHNFGCGVQIKSLFFLFFSLK